MPLTALSAIPAVLCAACGGGGSSSLDASTLDAETPPDAAVVACSADHAESAEPANDLSLGGAAEQTGLVVAGNGEAVSLCGQIDPSQAGPETADADFYRFELGDDLRLRAELRAADGSSASDLELALWLTNDSGSAVALLSLGRFRGDHAVVELGTLAAGTYALSVRAGLPEPAAPVVYEVSLLEDPDDCTAAANVTYVESGDGPGARGNDSVAISFSPAARFSDAGGTPEPTAIVLDSTAIAELSGESADIASDSDAYRDRDTFEVATDPLANEIEMRLTWDDTHGADLDLFVFEPGPGDELTAGVASLVGPNIAESATLSVTAGETYWLWIGAFDDGAGRPPVTYQLSVCGRQIPAAPAAPGAP